MESVKCYFYLRNNLEYEFKYSRNFKTMSHFISHLKALHHYKVTIYELDGDLMIKMEAKG